MFDSLEKLLKDKKVVDAYTYYVSCAYKLYFVRANADALRKIIDDYQNEERAKHQKVFEDAINKGVGHYISEPSTVDFFGVTLDSTVAIDKLTMESLSLLHSFFDTFSQWINAVLLAEEALKEKSVSLSNIVGKIQQYPQYTGTFIQELINIPTTPEYEYVADYNNTLKHRSQIFIQNKFDILHMTGDVTVPAFSKDGNTHPEEDVLNKINESLNFCEKLLNDSRAFVEQYYASNDCSYVQHRIYNPNTYLLFESHDDYKKGNPKNHYAYIEVDPNAIDDEYHIMLCFDHSDDEEDPGIDLYNSPYPIIMLRSITTRKIVGILKPIDGESFQLKDEHRLQYRKYCSIKNGYELEMYQAICEGPFHVYPFLSNISGVIITQCADKCEDKKTSEN